MKALLCKMRQGGQMLLQKIKIKCKEKECYEYIFTVIFLSQFINIL